MSEYSLEQDKRACGKKRKFTKLFAVNHVNIASARGLYLRSYKCRICKYFHMAVDKERLAMVKEQA
jgi:hypothetical protein